MRIFNCKSCFVIKTAFAVCTLNNLYSQTNQLGILYFHTFNYVCNYALINLKIQLETLNAQKRRKF